MYIKIYTKSQLVLLRSVNGLFRKKYRLPQEILNRVEARAGHQDPKITLSVYSHVAKDDENLVANLMDERLFKKVSNE